MCTYHNNTRTSAPNSESGSSIISNPKADMEEEQYRIYEDEMREGTDTIKGLLIGSAISLTFFWAPLFAAIFYFVKSRG